MSSGELWLIIQVGFTCSGTSIHNCIGDVHCYCIYVVLALLIGCLVKFLGLKGFFGITDD